MIDTLNEKDKINLVNNIMEKVEIAKQIKSIIILDKN